MSEQNNNQGSSPYGAYGAPQQPPVPPQNSSPYATPQTPQGQPQANAPYTNPYQTLQGSQGGHFPAAQKPLVVETAYAFLCFLWIFGAHKFYLRQTMQGVAYLGAWVATLIISAVLGNFLGFLGWLAIAASAYADIRTMKEQVERSNRGEVFPVPSQLEFIKKAFNRS